MKKIALAAVLLCAFALPSFAAGIPSRVKVINQSKWEIHHIYLSASDSESWGPDQLEDMILAKGDSVTINGIPCDTYDIKVVDEDGDECIIEQIELCGDNAFWKITDKHLLECEGYE